MKKIPMSRTLAALGVCAALLVASLPASASLVTTRAGLGGTDFIDWSQLGPNLTQLASSANVTTDDGLAATVTNPSGSMQRRDQGTGWLGNFASGDAVLWTGPNPGPLTIDFSAGLSAIGAQIQMNNLSAFTGVISVFDSLNNLLETHNLAGISSDAGDNSAIFIGISRGTADIDHVIFDIAGTADFAINRVDLNAGGQVPEPGSLALFSLALGAAAFARRRKAA